MLSLHHSDELDPLLDALADMLAPAPADPFTPDVVSVPAVGVRDAAMVGLGHRLGASASGSGDGISANIEFLFPGRFMARALGDTGRDSDPEGDPWRLPRLTWAVLDVLASGTVAVPGTGGTDAQQWALARRIADLFDRYATQRPRLIENWALGTDSDGTHHTDGTPALLDPAHHWQAQLWRAVRAHIGVPSPPERLPDLLHSIANGSVQPQLPQRVAVFGVGGVAPTMLKVLRALGETRDVHVFLRHPSMAAWQSSPYRLAGGLNVRANVDVSVAVTHPLLVSWARPALEARALVHGDAQVHDVPHGAPPAGPPTTLLHALQHGVRLDQKPIRNPAIDATDGSFQVHACHGAVRQLEALREVLGHAFVADPTLQPHEVLVLSPDLTRFAPLVKAVFQRGALPVPVCIGDRSLTTDEPIIDAVQALLTLVSGRATLSEVLGLVQFEPVRRRFGWSIDHLEQFAAWCETLGARWGLSAEHRAPWGLPAGLATGTWRSMVDQLLAGVAMAAPTPRLALGDTAPYDDLAGDDFELVGTVADLLARLIDLHALVQSERPVADWIELLHRTVDEFCAPDPDDPSRRQQVHRELADIVRSARSPHDADITCGVPLSLADVRALLTDSLSQRAGRLPLRSGSVTVSSMVPQHGVPARVICLLGLDEGSLRGGTFDGDDILGLHPCVGERHPRHESRQLLLDALLAASERLVITCNGADLTNNKELPFVVPLVELLDVVGHLVPLEAHQSPVVVRHPRHGFHERALQPGLVSQHSAAPFTFDPSMLAAAEARRRSMVTFDTIAVSPWALTPMVLDQVGIDQLMAVVANPSKVYLKSRLDVRVPDEEAALDDGLSVGVSVLGASALGRHLLEVRRQGGAADEWEAAARLDGALPPGELSTAALSGVRNEVALLEASADAWSVPLAGGTEATIDQTFWVSIDGAAAAPIHLHGKVSNIAQRANGPTVVRVNFSKERPSFRLAAAVQLAALQRHDPDTDWSAVVISRGDRGKILASGLRLCGDGNARLERANQLLTMSVQLLAWAQRDAVPYFDRVSAELAVRKYGGVESAIDSDMLDRHCSLLWPELSLESLLVDPVLATDPDVVQPDDDAQTTSSRASAVAQWVWNTYDATIETIDAEGAVLGALSAADEEGDGE